MLTKIQQNPKGFIIAALLIIAVIWGIYHFIYNAGKAAANGPQAEYPNGGKDIPANWDASVLAKQLHDAMAGVTWTSTDAKAWVALTNLPTQEMILAVYNVFGQLYFPEGKGDLVQWINDEDTLPDYLGGNSNEKQAALNVLKNALSSTHTNAAN